MLGVVSGSGLQLLELLDKIVEEFSFSSRLGIEYGALAGHDRRFVRGVCAGRELIVQCGRLHFYEGLTFDEVVRPVDVLHEDGVTRVVFTNVVGGLRTDMKPGEVVAAREVRTWPFLEWHERPDQLRPDLMLHGCDRTGVYYWMHGPSYETPAEIAALQRLGGDVVGMSTAPEMVRCRQLGIACGVVSCVTNNCCTPQILTHEEVVAVAQQSSKRVCAIVRAAIASGAI